MLLSRATFPVVSDNLSTFDVTGNIAGDDIVTTGYTENFPWKHRNLCPKLCLESSVAPYSADNHSKILYFVSFYLLFCILNLSFYEPVTGINIFHSGGLLLIVTAYLQGSLRVNVLIYPQNAPHTQDVVTSDTWDRPYSREVAAFPAVSIKLVFL